MYGHEDDRGFRPRNITAPVKVGDELDVKVEAVGEKGDGIAKKDGFVLFIPNTKEGDQVRIRVTKVLRKVGFAEVVGEGSASEDAGQNSGEEAPAGDAEAPQESSQDSGSSQDSEDFGEESEDKQE